VDSLPLFVTYKPRNSKTVADRHSYRQHARVAAELFGTDGIRGVANQEPLTPTNVVRLAEAAAAVLLPGGNRDSPCVVIGRDTRESGDFLEAALSAGLSGSGIDVLLTGVIPTPAVARLTITRGANFGVVISASHNPYADNGIKFFGPDGFKLTDAQESAIEEQFESRTSKRINIGRLGRVRTMSDAGESYRRYVASTVDPSVRLDGWRICLDLANGAAYRTTQELLSSLGAELIVHYAEPDGRNINVNCGSTHPEVLARLVRETKANVGLAHDGDADRLLLCDEYGDPLDGDEILAVAAAHLASQGRLERNTVVATVMSNFGLDALLSRFQGKVVRTAVGDRHVVEVMRAQSLNLGGEQSGHVVFGDYCTTGDGLVSALQIFAIMEATGKPLSQLRAVLQKLPQEQRNIPVREKRPWQEIPAIHSAVQSAERALNGQGRVLLRYSGTEPKIRLLLEGPDPAQLKHFADEIELQIRHSLPA
jgi:phosphoglucosamine mutase